MAHNPANELASAIQSASIKYNPDPKFDINPSTAANKRTPVRVRAEHHRRSSASAWPADDDAAQDEIPLSALEVPPRIQGLPPLPDMRFEQSYLAKVAPYVDEGRYVMVALVTLFDHVVSPFAQGVLWNLTLHGWRVWNVASRFQGRSWGARVRRWWWRTNNWKLPEEA